MNGPTVVVHPSVLERLAAIRRMIMEARPTITGVTFAPLAEKRSIGGRYFKRVKGRRSASLRERSQRRKVTR